MDEIKHAAVRASSFLFCCDSNKLHTMLEMFVRDDCAHCKNAVNMVYAMPSSLQAQIKISPITFQNRPPNVTRVPTLVTQQGKMLVGANVFAYLKRWRHDASPPHTEAFLGVSQNRVLCILFFIAVIVALYYLWVSRGGGVPAFLANASSTMKPVDLSSIGAPSPETAFW